MNKKLFYTLGTISVAVTSLVIVSCSSQTPTLGQEMGKIPKVQKIDAKSIKPNFKNPPLPTVDKGFKIEIADVVYNSNDPKYGKCLNVTWTLTELSTKQTRNPITIFIAK